VRDWSASRFRRASALDGLALVAVALVVLVVFLDKPHVLPRTSEALNLSPAMLPLYAAYSLLRMLAAYAVSLGFALGAGYWASASPTGRRLILPALDLLQAVPILGFLPATIFFFIRLFHGSPLGVEAAAVFLIFTSQAWNMAFSVYESLTTIPDDLLTAARVSGLSGVVRWRRLLLPACVPRLVYNSMLSWAGGWYFLIASEIIAVGRRTWILPGLGSYIGESMTLGRHGLAAAGLVSLVAVIGLLDVLVWSPLASWSGRFRYETSAAGEASAPPLVRSLLRRAPLVRGGLMRVGRRMGELVGRVAAAASHALSHQWIRPLLALLAVGSLAALAYSAVQTVEVLLRPLPSEAVQIPLALLLSFLRLLLAYAISLAWTIPLACWVSRSARRAGRLMPVVQVVASVPATAFFPLLVALVLWLRLDLNVSAVALVLTGMQWYLLFNLVAAAQAIPEDVRELARATGAGGFFYLRRFFLPAALPSLITGSLTAWGGGWNALVLAESVSAAGRTWSVKGIGTLLDEATYVKSDLQMITLVIVSMVAAVLLLNRAVWRPLYAWASVRYRFDA
jgi:NitT/TauT family transport system permease protein